MDTIDDIGRRAAATMHAEANALADPDVMLHELAAATAAPGRGQRFGLAPPPAGPPRRWAVIGAAAAVLVAVVLGIVVVTGRDPHGRVVPAPSVPPSPVTTSPAHTEAPLPTQPATTTPATSTPVASVPITSPPASSIAPSTGDGLAVSYKNPPPFLEPLVLASLQVDAGDDVRSGGLAIMESGIVVLDGGQAHVVGWDGATRTVDVTAASESNYLGGLAAGPGDVLYAIASGNNTTNMTAAEVWAIPLTGDRAGQVVASSPVDMNVIVERPAASFGHGPSGLVDRIGRIDGVIAPYVDENGETWPEPLDIPGYRVDGDAVTSTDGSQSWPLQIERAPGSSDSFNGPAPPTPAPGGGAVWWDWIGPRSSNADYALGTMQVIAFLDADGSVSWRRIPDGWGVVASDLWGTVLARHTGETLELALATPSLATAPELTPAEHTVTTYLTALAARDYAAAAALLGNDGRSPTERADLAAVRGPLVGGDSLEDALRDWCESTSPAACWMPTTVTEQTEFDGGAAGPAPVAATYGRFTARFLVGSWEGRPSVFGLPPLTERSGLERARQLLGVDALYAGTDDGGAYRLWLTSSTGAENLAPPLGTVGASAVTRDGHAISWTSGDPVHTTVTDINGTVLCDVDAPILELVGQPGAYRAITTRDGPVGPPEAPEPQPAFEIDCATGTETPTDPWTWNSGAVYARKYVAGERTFIATGTDHHSELTDESGLTISGGDNVFTSPAFVADGSVVVYGAHTGSANPWLSTHVIARDGTTGRLLWDTELDAPVNAVLVTDDRVVVQTGVSASSDQFGTAGLTLIDLATGEVMLSLPAVFNLLHVE